MTDLTARPRRGRRSNRRGTQLLVRGCAAGVALLVGVAAWGVAVPEASAAGSADAWVGEFGDGGNAATNPGESVITAAKASRVSQAWTAGSSSTSYYAPAVAGGLAYQVVSVNGASYLTALSPRTGATVGSALLPREYYSSGLTISGQDAILPYNGWGNTAGGLVAVDLSSGAVIGQVSLPPASLSWVGNFQAGMAYTDGARVYVEGAGNAINAYRLSDGGLAWTLPPAFRSDGFPLSVEGMVVGAGVVYTSGAQGVVAYDAATGRQLWSGGGGYVGTPVLAGGRIFVNNTNSDLAAFPAAGCGTTVCAPLWTSKLTGGASEVTIGGADASTLFVTYETTQPPAPGTTTSILSGVVARLAAATGTLQWTTSPGTYTGELVRGGNVVWLIGAVSGQNRILGYSTSATGSTPLASIPLAQRLQNFPQTLAIASGTLFQQVNAAPMVGYRIRGT
jgi:hypothetical protein